MSSMRTRTSIVRKVIFKMIKLEVEDYCHDCRAFDPETEEVTSFSIGNPYLSDTVVKCHNAKWCARMMQRLERKLRKEQENGSDD